MFSYGVADPVLDVAAVASEKVVLQRQKDTFTKQAPHPNALNKLTMT